MTRPALWVWSAVTATYGAVAALTGTPTFVYGPHRAPAVLDWVLVALAGLAALATALPRLRYPAVGLLAAAAFGLLMNVITLVVAQRVDDWPAALAQALCAAGAILLVRLASRHRRRPARDAAPAVPTAAGRRVQVAAVVGALAFVPYAVMKTTWALGGRFAGMTGAQMLASYRRNGASPLFLTLESWGLDPTALLAALGVVLLFALVRPWGTVWPRWLPVVRGRRVPRWLPLTPALLGAATLAPYGIGGLVYCTLGAAGVIAVPRGDAPTSADTLLMAFLGVGPFAVYGTALALATASYLRRTRAGTPEIAAVATT